MQTRYFFTPVTSKQASRHNGVPFIIFLLASWPRTCRSKEPMPGALGLQSFAQKKVVRAVSRLSYLFRLFLYYAFFTLSDFCFSSLLSLSLLSCCFRVHLSIFPEIRLGHISCGDFLCLLHIAYAMALNIWYTDIQTYDLWLCGSYALQLYIVFKISYIIYRISYIIYHHVGEINKELTRDCWDNGSWTLLKIVSKQKFRHG